MLTSGLVSSNLVSAYIPFLPLEVRHVTQCIIDGLIARGYYDSEYQVDEGNVNKILNELKLYTSDRQLSTSGCKRVMEKIDFVMQTEE